MKKAVYSLRLQPSLKVAMEKFALQEGIGLNQFINVAVAKKLAAVDTETFFKDRTKSANREDFLAFVDGSKSEPPIEGDEL